MPRSFVRPSLAIQRALTRAHLQWAQPRIGLELVTTRERLMVAERDLATVEPCDRASLQGLVLDLRAEVARLESEHAWVDARLDILREGEDEGCACEEDDLAQDTTRTAA